MTEQHLDVGLTITSARLTGRAVVVPLYCVTLFFSSALLFVAEPMFAKMVLPLLGGTPGVWNTCMVSFQALLLAGYAYGHWSIKHLGVRRQRWVQMFLLAAVAFVLPIAVPTGSRPPAGHNPILWLLAMLPVGVGLPFFAVAGTAPVLQKWFSATGHRAGRDPYFLYAASNVGSMAALLAYPTLLEPFVRLIDQTRLWSIGYVGLVATVGCCGLFVNHSTAIGPTAAAEPITARRRVRWILLAMVPSSLLLGTTTFITTDIAAVPLLWIVPLAIYLFSFILVFSSRQILPRSLMVRLLPVVVLGVAMFMLGRVAQPVWMVLCLHLAALFTASIVCHGELAADRPSVGRLTDFYLTMSVGGVVGGLFNALLAPVLFHSAAEYPLALIAACALAPAGRSACKTAAQFRLAADLFTPVIVAAMAVGMPVLLAKATGIDAIGMRMVGIGSAVMVAVTAIQRRWRFAATLGAMFFVVGNDPAGGRMLAIERSFFGIHRVVATGHFNDLYHGTTVHGRQIVDPAGRPVQPTTALTYYHRTGPIGQFMLQRTAAGRANNVAVVGLGVGSLAAYAGPQTHLTFFEIDPAVRWVARDSGYFSFLSSAQQRNAKIDIVMGDARLTLAGVPDQSCDVLVLDAFCGDAIPVHLLTREAMKIYTAKLSPGGVLAIHISNMYLDLTPVISALTTDAGYMGMYQNDLAVSPDQSAGGKTASQWVIVGQSSAALSPQMQDTRWHPLPPATMRVWTDDFSNVLSVFRWR